MRTVAVVGGSLAGISAARALRQQDFDGRIVVIGAEEHLPYDRPPLSKDFLAARVGAEDLELTGPEDDALDLQWRLGDAAVGLRPGGSAVVLSSGAEVAADGVVLATGGRARTMLGSGLEGVHTLRTLEDALALRRELTAGRRLVVIGGGFIGAEVASTAREHGVEVTVIEAGPTPLGRVLGPELGEACCGLPGEHGVRLVTGVPVLGLIGDTRVRGVQLAGDRVEPADVVVVGIGALPNVEWLAGSGVGFDERGVWTDAGGATSLPGVVAAGDCAFSHSDFTGTALRQEHWTNAVQQPVTAVATLLGRTAPAKPPAPYFWSDQYGARLQFAGHRLPDDSLEIVEGDVSARSFVACYVRGGATVAVFAMNQPKIFGRLRRQLTPRHLATADSP